MDRPSSSSIDVEQRSRPARLPIARGPSPGDLAAELARHLRGEVRFGDGDRAMYATDASNYRQVPIGVVVPRDEQDVIATVAICRAFGAPILSRGGGTSLAGQTCNRAVVLDFSKYMNAILELDPERRIARVQPGVVLDDLRSRAEEFKLTFGPDPSTHNHCTLGGMIGNNSCGVHSVMAGCTSANVIDLEVLTYDGTRLHLGPTSEDDFRRMEREGGRAGEIYGRIRRFRDTYADAIRGGFPDLPRRVSGYNLPALVNEDRPNLARAVVGSEGTLVTILSATVRLVHSPPSRVLLVLGYPSVYEAGAHIEEVMKSGPIGLEGLDDILVEDMKKKSLHPERAQLLPDGRGWLMVEFGGDDRKEAEDKAKALMRTLGHSRSAPTTKLFDDPKEEKILWKVRESGLGATARVPGQPDAWEGWEDSSVHPSRLDTYLRQLRALLDRYGFHAALYGHFGQGCVHTRIPFDLKHQAGIEQYRAFVEEAADLVTSLGGSLSGEHGDGQSRAELLPKMFSPELMKAFGEWKAIWDPDDKMNPGKVVRPYRLDENLRLGADYHPWQPRTHFHFPDDKGSLSYASERCVGVGECRRSEGGTMCPSYRVTREEKHSTRGRAHLLFEVMRGEVVRDGWQDEALRESLDLCLACKGCKGECPVNVDMATYKAEFLSHYYERRLRPRSAYAFGLIYWWARLASLVPELANAMLRIPILSNLAKWLAGAHQRRSLPTFAPLTFKQWWHERPVVGRDRPRVLLWVDTWANHFQPAVAVAAVDVLEHAGFRVVVPQQSLCCGRPLYDYGMLDLAKRQLRQILDAIRPALRLGIPIVGLEPSCMSVFHDELPNLFPDDDDARRLKEHSFMLSDFLLHQADGWKPPRLERKALVQGHCHHKAVLSFDKDEEPLMHKLGLDVEILDAGCCGMAGAFGYEAPHYDVSIACGEERLLPAVRGAHWDTVIVADGFSCREQIGQETRRKALHTAQLLQMATQQGPQGPRKAYPERDYADVRLPIPLRIRLGRWLFLAGAALLTVGATRWAVSRRRGRSR